MTGQWIAAPDRSIRSGSWPASPGRRLPCMGSTTSLAGPRSSWPTIRVGSTRSCSPRCCHPLSASSPARCSKRQVLSGFVLKRLGTVFVERHEREHGVADTAHLVALVRAGQSLVIFPEGHLARAPGLRPFHMGAFVAAEAGVPALPLAIHGTRAMYRPEHRVPRRGAVDIAIGQPVEAMGTDWAAAVQLQRAAREAVLRLSGEPDVE